MTVWMGIVEPCWNLVELINGENGQNYAAKG